MKINSKLHWLLCTRVLFKMTYVNFHLNILIMKGCDKLSYYTYIPMRQDDNFWAATSTFFATPPYVAEARADGFHFRGKKTYNGSSLIKLSFGVKSRYELHASRVPRPNQPPWRSAPHVELFGQLLAWTERGGIFSGDNWSKCWMIRRQTLSQFIFAQPGTNNERKIGEAIEVQNIFNEENRGRNQSHRFIGHQPMPPVVLTQIFPGVSIWAELEVRFDIQLEGNSLLWIEHPFDIVVRGFQWPLRPI